MSQGSNDPRLQELDRYHGEISNYVYRAGDAFRRNRASEGHNQLAMLSMTATNLVSYLTELLPQTDEMAATIHRLDNLSELKRYQSIKVQALQSLLRKEAPNRPRCSCCKEPLKANIFYCSTSTNVEQEEPYVGMPVKTWFHGRDYQFLDQEQLDHITGYTRNTYKNDVTQKLEYSFNGIQIWMGSYGFNSGKPKLNQYLASSTGMKLYEGIEIRIPDDKEVCHRQTCINRLLHESTPTNAFVKIQAKRRGEARGFDL